MGFNTALSGLNAASNMLAVTGNNIANANTTGFKKSRSEFADVYASSVGSVGKSTPGSGVVVANVAQSFVQGNLQSTQNALDLAISGDGFFVLGESVDNTNQRTYTRAGMFRTDDKGYVVNNNGQPMLVQKPNGNTVEEGFNPLVLQTLRIDSSQGEPSATSLVTTSFNLDARKDVPANPFVGPVSGVVDPTTYTHATSVTVYDSLGNPHLLSQYFVKDPTVVPTPINTWKVYSYIDSTQITTATSATTAPATVPGDTLQFDTTGKLVSPANGKLVYNGATVAPNANPMAITLDMFGSTQVGSPFVINNLTQDGLATGRLTSLDVDDAGTVFARFSNGANKPLGRVAIARFDNPQGLAKLGDTRWGESSASGVPKSGTGGVGGFGSIKSGTLESSNVDLAAQLVNLIIAQQAYQANAQTISTENEITRTLLQIR
jgi:flagellar hook protein FlgE